MIYPLKGWQSLRYGFKFGQKYPRGWGNLTGQPHIGVDKMAKTGTPIYAHASGSLKRVRTLIQGRAIHIIDANGHLCRYMHLSAWSARNGRIRKGALIGYVGSTGASSGNHLHFDVSKKKTFIPRFSNFINPELYLQGKVK